MLSRWDGPKGFEGARGLSSCITAAGWDPGEQSAGPGTSPGRDGCISTCTRARRDTGAPIRLVAQRVKVTPKVRGLYSFGRGESQSQPKSAPWPGTDTGPFLAGNTI